jgi:hypothetical protein
VRDAGFVDGRYAARRSRTAQHLADNRKRETVVSERTVGSGKVLEPCPASPCPWTARTSVCRLSTNLAASSEAAAVLCAIV